MFGGWRDTERFNFVTDCANGLDIVDMLDFLTFVFSVSYRVD